MESPLICTICGSSTAWRCGVCRSAAYCSTECQQTDWRTHRYLCRAFKQISESSFLARPSPNHYLAIYFPMVNRSGKPRLHWVSAREVEPGFFEPELDQLLALPGHTGYLGRGMRIVRGNIMRGRPKFPDSLNIRFLDDMRIDNHLKVNDTLHGSPAAVCADGWGDMFWKGPIVAFLKAGNAFDARAMMDINLTAYRDAIDYLAYYLETIGSMIDEPGSQHNFSKRVMEDRSGRAKAVRINCIRDQAGDISRQFEQVYVSKTHPLFVEHCDDPLDIVQGLGEAWVMGSYPSPKNTSPEADYNPYAPSLLGKISEYYLDREDWGEIKQYHQPQTTGSVLIVHARRRDLDLKRVRAVCMAIEQHVVPLLDSESHADRQAVLDALTEEVVQQYM